MSSTFRRQNLQDNRNIQQNMVILKHTINFNVKILSYFPRRIYWYLWISCDSHNKGKGHAMTCLCRRRRETELQFQHIRNPVLGGGECQHHVPTV
jgi:hypothetical protein